MAKHKIFISYASRDREVADRVRDGFERAGVRCWIAPRDIREGQDWSAAIPPAIDTCEIFLLILSAAASASSQIAREVHIAQAIAKAVVVFRIDSEEPTGALRYLLAGLHRLDASQNARARLGDLLERVRQMLVKHEENPAESEGGNVPNNLPTDVSSFVGRETALDDVAVLLRQERMVTLHGPGGVGKSRTALAIARRTMGEFPDGVWLIELGALTSGSMVAEIIDEPRWAQDSAALIVVDNCEHVLAAASAVLRRIVTSTKKLRVLCTSREPLGLPEERLFSLGPLAAPVSQNGLVPSLQELNASPAARLFLDRVGERGIGSLERTSARVAVADICRRLDGIPLALELASARAHVLSFEEIAEAIDGRFRLLTKGDARAAPRHRTLHALIEWSIQLLSEAERAVFTSLGAFRGRFSLEDIAAASDASHDSFELVDIVGALIDKSLVVPAEVTTAKRRFDLLESVRAYSRELLDASGKRDEAFGRLAEHVLRSMEELTSQSDPAPIEAELDNVRAVLSHFVTDRRDVMRGARLLVSLDGFWQASGRWTEARGWYESVLQGLEPNEEDLRAQVLLACGAVAYYREDYAAAIDFYKEALRFFDSSGNESAYSRALTRIASAEFERGSWQTAEPQWLQALEICRRLGNVHGTATIVANLGLVSWQVHLDYVAALKYYREALEIFRSSGSKMSAALTLGNIAEVLYALNDIEGAIAQAEESLVLIRELGNESYAADRMLLLAKYEFVRGRTETSAMLLRDALATFSRLNQSLEIAEGAMLAARLAHGAKQTAAAAELLAFGYGLRRSAKRPAIKADSDSWVALRESLEVCSEIDLASATRRGELMTMEQGLASALAVIDGLSPRL